MESTLEPVQPVKPPAPHMGGKSLLADRIVDRIEGIPHTLYAEPFIGMGGVFLRRRYKPACEVINDLDGELVTFFRILQRHYTPFLEMLRYQITSRAEFDRLKACAPSTLTDLERAARFLYLQKTAFGGKRAGQTFGVNFDAPARFDITTLVPALEAVHERLARVLIENRPWQDLVKVYDREGALFYLDPPYWGGENDYGKGMFARDDFERISEALSGISGKFLLSINDVPEIREIFSDFKIDAVKTRYSVGKDANQEVGELLITNYTEPPVNRLL